MKFTIEFHRVTCEKAFLEIEAVGFEAASAVARTIATNDPRLEFEPMSSTMEVASVKPSKI